MDKKIAIAIAVVVIVIAAAAVIVVATDDDKDDGYKPAAYDDSDVRLRIFGNADGNDVIDSKDIETIQMIIDANNDSDASKHIDWQSGYYYADANHDGKIDSNDVQYVQDIIDKKPLKLWYETAFATLNTYATGENKHIDAYVNYPIGHKVGCESNMVDFLGALGVYDYFSATVKDASVNYGEGTYPGISKLPEMGQSSHLDIQSVEQLYKNGTIDTLIMWTGGMAKMYLWDDAVNSGVADHVSMVMVTCQGEHCINGVLMLACMFGDQSLSDKYKAWYDGIMDRINAIGTTVQKKTVLAVTMFDSTTASTISAYKQYQPPALWWSKIINYVDNCNGVAGFLKLGSIEALEEELETYNVTEMITMSEPEPADSYENFNKYIEKKMHDLFQTLPIYENQKIYTINFALMPFFGGPAGCMLLAAQLYPDAFEMEDAIALTQEYIDNFMPVHHDARYGYTYTGDGYYPYKG